MQEHVDEQISKKHLKMNQLRADERKEKSKKHNEVSHNIHIRHNICTTHIFDDSG